MLSTLVTCAALLTCSANAAPAADTQPNKAAAAPTKFEILAIEQSIVDNCDGEVRRRLAGEQCHG